MDNFTTATEEGIPDAEKSGYSRVKTESYALKDPNGTVPLKVYRNPNNKDYFTTATSLSAGKAGYKLVTTEGYIYPAEVCQR